MIIAPLARISSINTPNESPAVLVFAITVTFTISWVALLRRLISNGSKLSTRGSRVSRLASANLFVPVVIPCGITAKLGLVRSASQTSWLEL